jgi:hypothetical protein
MVGNPEKPSADIVGEENSGKVKQSEQEVIGEQEENQGSQGSWRTAAPAWSTFASWLEAVGCVRCIDLVEEQTEVVQTTADFVVRSPSNLMCSYGSHLVDR